MSEDFSSGEVRVSLNLYPFEISSRRKYIDIDDHNSRKYIYV